MATLHTSPYISSISSAHHDATFLLKEMNTNRPPVQQIVDEVEQTRIEAQRALDAERCLLPALGETAMHARRRVDTGVQNLVTMVQDQLSSCVTVGVALVGKENVFYKCIVGQNSLEKQLPRVISIADHAIRSSASVFEVHNLKNTEFATHPNVMRIPHAASYASCCLCSPNTFKIGVLFVMRSSNKSLTGQERRFLQLATRTCETLLWQATDSYMSEISAVDNIATLCHELRNLIGPATTITTLLLQHKDVEPVKKFAGLIQMLKGNVHKTLQMVQDMQNKLVAVSRQRGKNVLERATQAKTVLNLDVVTGAHGCDDHPLPEETTNKTSIGCCGRQRREEWEAREQHEQHEQNEQHERFEQLSNKSIVERYALLHDRIIGTVQEAVIFEGKPESLHQVFTNLISNAYKYADKDSFIYVSSWVAPEKRHVVFSVRDLGPGIDKQKQKFLFSYHGNKLSKTTHGTDSTGIGLFVCRQLVEQEHGGVIRLNAKYTRGCDFQLMLPIKREARFLNRNETQLAFTYS
jgi:signal transduction histidine kinase